MGIDQAQAIVFGLAVGDALGAPVRDQHYRQIQAAYGRDGIQQPPVPALVTANTRHSQRVILDGTNAPLEDGQSSPAARSLLLGYRYQADHERLIHEVEAVCRRTHTDPASIAGSIAAAYLVALTLNGVHLHEYIRRVMTFCDDLSDALDLALLRIGHVLGWTDEKAAMNHIGDGHQAETAAALGLYCVLRYDADYAACVRCAANFDGDSATVAAIAGAIMGARLGTVAGPPPGWADRLPDQADLLRVAAQL